ncbi:hypothetical protein HZH68_014986 [Vespula germanica]|uniref:Uncharacterized protein n=1 Tax=Vespula germanica TaxID=30212 RepID=A0A834J823_VESGE|nr:hypothetical protein HZH68_014986 [Vespula germanica]
MEIVDDIIEQDGNQLNSILKPKSVEQQGNDRKQSHPECRIGIVESLLKNIPLPGYLTEVYTTKTAHATSGLFSKTYTLHTIETKATK